MDIDHDGTASRHLLEVRVSGPQLEWLLAAGKAQEPRVDSDGMLIRLLERAINEDERNAGRRAHQLEVFRASGYSEHHPDYPNLPKGLPDQ